jgi:hypothetical protein
MGRIYIANRDDHSIVRMDDMVGTNRVDFGTMGNGDDQFDGPSSLALDSMDRIYIGDTNNARVVRMNDMAGANFVAYGTLGSGDGQFSNISDVFVDDTGIYVTDSYIAADRLVRFDDMTGANWQTFGTNGGGVNQFALCNSVQRYNGHIYLVDRGNDRIVRIDNMTGTGWTTYDMGSNINPAHLSVGPDGAIYFSVLDRLFRIDEISDMATLDTYGTSGAGMGQFSLPWGIHVI